MEKLLRISDVAKMLNVSRVTIYEWIRTGKIKFITLPNDKKRISQSEVDKILGR